MSTIGLRPATAADDEFCYQVHRAAMRAYVEEIWGWDEATQVDYHRRGFDPTRTRIITVDGSDAGVLIVDYRPAEIYLGRIELNPEYQGRGIGGCVIQLLRHEATVRHQPVILDVLTVNSRAYQLYRRLGFYEIGRHGEHNIRIRMLADPIVP